jgi:2,4-dienoyl-CoA reductase-like NADH-dependent reductase (Old Yellow Enzyme family)
VLTHQAYDEIGGVNKAIANHAEQVYQKLSENLQQQAQRIFLQLVHPGEGTEGYSPHRYPCRSWGK